MAAADWPISTDTKRSVVDTVIAVSTLAVLAPIAWIESKRR